MRQIQVGNLWHAIAVVLILGIRSVSAELSLSLSSPDDLENLTVGQALTIEAHLSGIDANQELKTLGADILVDETVFGAITGPVSGPIVPDPGSNFIAFADPDLVTGAFFNNTGSAAINSSGLFLSFTMTVMANSTGSILLAPDAIFAEQAGGAVLPITAGAPLAFSVPEPTILFALVVPAVALFPQRRGA